jgi:hypothetical protein
MEPDGTLYHSENCVVCEILREIASLTRQACMTNELSHAHFLHELEMREWDKYHNLPLETVYNCSKDIEIAGELLSQGIPVP